MSYFATFVPDASDVSFFQGDHERNLQEVVSELLRNQRPTGSDLFASELIVITTEQVAEKRIQLEEIAHIPEATSFIIVGGFTQSHGEDFVVTGSELSWNGLGLDGLIEAGDLVRVGYFLQPPNENLIFYQNIITLTNDHISQRYLEIPHGGVLPETLQLQPIGGSAQVLSVDYEVVGSLLSWSGKGLEPLLATSDKLVISYFYDGRI